MAASLTDADGSNMLSTLLLFAALLGLLVLRQMAVRWVRRSIRESGLSNNRIFQIAAVLFVLFFFIRALGALTVVFVALGLVIGGVLWVANKVKPGAFQPAARSHDPSQQA